MPDPAATTTFTIEPISAERLEGIVNAVIEAGGEVDQVNMATSGLLDDYVKENSRTLHAQLRGEDAPGPKLVGRLSAEQAWHLHQFAVDVKQAAGFLIEWADEIDEATHRLYLYSNDEKGDNDV